MAGASVFGQEWSLSHFNIINADTADHTVTLRVFNLDSTDYLYPYQDYAVVAGYTWSNDMGPGNLLVGYSYNEETMMDDIPVYHAAEILIDNVPTAIFIEPGDFSLDYTIPLSGGGDPPPVPATLDTLQAEVVDLRRVCSVMIGVLLCAMTAYNWRA